MQRVLLVDDDRELSQMLSDYLTKEGFETACAYDGESGLQQALNGNFDVVVLDIMLPRLDGISALRSIRQASVVPVLMLTAKGDDIDRIVGLEIGADDYLPKPCNPRELLARIRAILRRSQNLGKQEPFPQSDKLTCGGLEIDAGSRAASYFGQPLELTSTEFNLLLTLAREAGKVVSKERLSEQGLGRGLTLYDRSVDMHISKLRKKLVSDEELASPIQTIRGIGYQYLVE